MVNVSLNILQRLNKVMKIVEYVQKEKPEGMKYSIVSHDSVTALVRPELVKSGIIYYPCNMQYDQQGNRTQVQLDLRFVNIDDKTDYIDVACLGYGCDGQDKGPGKAVSYAVKYGLLKALGLKTGDDADFESVDYHEWQGPKKKTELKQCLRDLAAELNKLTSKDTEEYLVGVWEDHKDILEQTKVDLPDWYEAANVSKDKAKERINTFPGDLP